MLRFASAGLVLLVLLAGCSATPDGTASGDPSSSTQSSTSPASTSTGSSSTTTTAPASSAVQISGFAFQPKQVSIAVGQAVTWTQQDSAPHTVSSDAGAPVAFDSGNLAKGQQFTFTFTTAGTYGYHCKLHSSMTGTVTVT